MHFAYHFFFLCCSGDQDSVIPLTGSRTLVHNLANEIGLKTTIPYRVWFEGKQVNAIFLIQIICDITIFRLGTSLSQILFI